MALYRVPFDFLIFNPAGSGGELIEFDAAGDPQTIAAGTLGQVLVADGAGSNAFQDPSTLTIDAADVTYDPAATLTPLVATDVQAAIDELEAIVNGLAGAGFGDIDALPAAAIASGDVLAFSGASVGGTESKTTTAELATVMITEGVGQSFDIDALPAGTADDLADLMVISDQTDSGNEKSITLTDLQSLIGSGSLDIDALPDGTGETLLSTDRLVWSDQSDAGTEKFTSMQQLEDYMNTNLTVGGGLTGTFTTGEISIVEFGISTVAHGLGAKPKIISSFLRCKIAEHGYSIGDELYSFWDHSSTTNELGAYGIDRDATNIVVRWGEDTSAGDPMFQIIDKAGTARANITNANWRLVVQAWV